MTVSASPTTHPVRVILWDIDKTLLLSDKRVNLFDNAFEELFGHPRPDDATISKGGKVDGQIAREYLALENSDDFDSYMRALNRISVEYYTRNPLSCVPGVPATLRATLDAGVINGLYTGNTPERASVKLTTAGIAPDEYFNGFAHGAAFCQGYSGNRLDGVPAVLAAFDPADVLIAGDTPRDYALAQAVGCRFWQVGETPIDDAAGIRVGRGHDFTGADGEGFLAALR